MKLSTVLLISAFSYVSNAQTTQLDICSNYLKTALSSRIKGTENTFPFFIANDVIVRGSDLNQKFIDTIFVLRCPDSFLKFKSLAANGIIYVKTRETFDAMTIGEILEGLKPKTGLRKVTFAVNGIIAEDLDIRISKKAVVRLDILLNSVNADKHVSRDVALVNIWTITGKQRRKGLKVPRACRGVIPLVKDEIIKPKARILDTRLKDF